MAAYRLLIKPSAAKEIESVGTKGDRRRIISRIAALVDEPRPPAAEKLAGAGALYRLRQGSYRVIYTIDSANAVIEIIKLGHRRDVYRSR